MSHVGGATCRTPPIPRCALEKDPRPGPLFEGNPVGPYMTTGKTITLTRQTFVGKVMSLLLNMLSRLVITFLPWDQNSFGGRRGLCCPPALQLLLLELVAGKRNEKKNRDISFKRLVWGLCACVPTCMCVVEKPGVEKKT